MMNTLKMNILNTIKKKQKHLKPIEKLKDGLSTRIDLFEKEREKILEKHRPFQKESVDRKMICKINKLKDKHETNSYSYDEYEEKDLHS